VERYNSSWRYEFYAIYDLPNRVDQLNPLIGGRRRRDQVASRRATPCSRCRAACSARANQWKELIAYSDQATKDGLSMRPVTAPRPVGVLLGLEGSQNPCSATPTYKSIAHLPRLERVKRMQDPEVRAKILSEDPIAGATWPLIRPTHSVGVDSPLSSASC
jgi:hypothetical protein